MKERFLECLVTLQYVPYKWSGKYYEGEILRVSGEFTVCSIYLSPLQCLCIVPSNSIDSVLHGTGLETIWHCLYQ